VADEGWESLEFWSSPEWAKIQEQLDDLEAKGIRYNPDRVNMFAALDACPYESCKVALFFQDPYPQKKFATGVAFAIPKGCLTLPQSLAQVLGEYTRDLNYSVPSFPDLSKWTSQGVLLWNVILTCQTGKSLSHYHWDWSWLTKEIIEKLNQKSQGCVLVFLGAVAREFEQYADHDSHHILWTAHPSPRGSSNTFNPFRGSRVFSRINDSLDSLGYHSIDWRL
jgi:uracil-DNA glycosylase